MHVSNYLDDVVVWAPAKVNLFLEVLGKRPDGYHEIATLMVAVRLYDTLVFRAVPTKDLTLRCSNAQLSSGPDNLVLRAAKLLQERTGCQGGASIRLIKRIPMAAGLAGGSADAAATLLGLNDLWKLGRSDAELAKIGAEIGSDIPFFFHTPAAWCTGRGEIVAPVPLSIPLDFVLLCPSFGMPTAAVYKNVVVPPTPTSGDAIRAALGQGDVDLIGKLLHNRLQTAAAGLDPRIAEYAHMLAEATPAGSLMSGSGSTLFALCGSPDEADRVAASLKTRTKAHDFRLIVTRSF
jgi:4-diphosphocytidyl-2-C-methyl-D-erythritol kinase